MTQVGPKRVTQPLGPVSLLRASRAPGGSPEEGQGWEGTVLGEPCQECLPSVSLESRCGPSGRQPGRSKAGPHGALVILKTLFSWSCQPLSLGASEELGFAVGGEEMGGI